MERGFLGESLRRRLLLALGVGAAVGCGPGESADDGATTGAVTYGGSGSETDAGMDVGTGDTGETGEPEPDLCELECADQFCTVYCDSFGHTVERIECGGGIGVGCEEPYGQGDSCDYKGGDLTCLGFGRVIAPALVGESFDGATPRARAWARIAALERASADSFERFAAQLERLGAPAGLIARARAAAEDERVHARLASARAGASESGAAAFARAADSSEPLAATEPVALADVVVETILGGCLGETLSALEAEHAAARASGPARAVLTRIAADEAAHAELAWAFVAWALGEQPGLAPTVAETLRRPIAPQPLGLDRASAGEGLLADEDRVALWQAGLREVVEPAAAALLAA